jgi:hypothetical protein
MRHFAGQHVGDGLDSPVGMPGESSQIVRRIIAAKVVQQQKSALFPKPKARCNFTPAPSTVGLVSRICFTGRSDMGNLLCLTDIGCAKEIFVATGIGPAVYLAQKRSLKAE